MWDKGNVIREAEKPFNQWHKYRLMDTLFFEKWDNKDRSRRHMRW